MFESLKADNEENKINIPVVGIHCESIQKLINIIYKLNYNFKSDGYYCEFIFGNVSGRITWF